MSEEKKVEASSDESFVSRSVAAIILSRAQSEGNGARVRRSVGRPELRDTADTDPFLLLDYFEVKGGNGVGFPTHPHRGFETLTYVLPWSEGGIKHQDFCGHSGTVRAGGIQLMTAGKAVVHSEMPDSTKVCKGLQLWSNLAGRDKMTEPAYQELDADKIPEGSKDGVKVRVIAGESLGAKSEVTLRNPFAYYHFTMDADATVDQPIVEGWNAFLFTLRGEVIVGDAKKAVGPFHTITLTPDGSGVSIRAASEEGADFVLIAGAPIREPVVQYGPFVMNTQEEIQQTFRDYQLGRNGFEKAPGWRATIDSAEVE